MTFFTHLSSSRPVLKSRTKRGRVSRDSAWGFKGRWRAKVNTLKLKTFHWGVVKLPQFFELQENAQVRTLSDCCLPPVFCFCPLHPLWIGSSTLFLGQSAKGFMCLPTFESSTFPALFDSLSPLCLKWQLFIYIVVCLYTNMGSKKETETQANGCVACGFLRKDRKWILSRCVCITGNLLLL